MHCQYYLNKRCSSCSLLNLEYAATVDLKEEELKKLFLGESLNLKESIHLDHYVSQSRSKAKLAVYGDLETIEFGIYNAHQEFVELEHCPLHLEGINDLLVLLKRHLKDFKITPYDIKTQKGELKYIILSKSLFNDTYLLRFTLRSKESIDRLRKMTEMFAHLYPHVLVITANIQPEHKAAFEGETEIVLSKETGILHQFGDVTLKLGPRSFFQVTPKIAQNLYESVGKLVADYKIRSFLDLYCGVGAFSFFAAKSAEKVKGVEISKEAIESANEAKLLNQTKGEIEFVAQDVDLFLKEHVVKSEAILVNPPRRGLNAQIIKSITDYAPTYLFYSSCNAKSLRNDYELLRENYTVVSTQIFDMFPYTEHYETLMVFKKRP